MTVMINIEARLTERRKTHERAEVERRNADRRAYDREQAFIQHELDLLAERRRERARVRAETARAHALEAAVTAWRNRVGEIARGV